MARTPWFEKLRSIARRARAEAQPAASVGGPSRREVLGAMSAALAAPSVFASGCVGSDARVAIVGGGVAGVHAAYRLAQAGVDYTLFEASNRLGGRMWSGRDLFADDQVCELGGELIDSNHNTLWALAEELGLELDDRLGPAFSELHPEALWVEGASVDEAALFDQFVAVLPGIIEDYEAAESEDDAYERLDLETMSDWLVRRVPLDTAPDLHRVLQVAYRGEFGLETDQQSALNLIYLIGLDDDAFRIFGASDERYHTHLGNDAFITGMAAGLPEGTVRLGHKLTKAAGRRAYELTFTTEAGEVTEVFDKVIFALPFSTLRLVDLTELRLSDTKREIIANLSYGTNAKVMAGFTRPVWREDHGQAGSVTTDLPFQQSWDTSIGQSGPSAILTNFLGGEQGVASAQGTPEAWVTDVLLPGLDVVFPGAAAAATGVAVRMHWPTMPHALGSYTCYTPGQWAWWSLEGEQEGNLHFAGEHTSADFQGWLEGGAESGARAALEVLDDLGVQIPAAFQAIADLQSLLPAWPAGRRNALRLLRQRRVIYRAWAELRGRNRR